MINHYFSVCFEGLCGWNAVKMYINYKIMCINGLAESFVSNWTLIKVYWGWDEGNSDYILPLERMLQLLLLLFFCQPTFSSAFHPVWTNSVASAGCIQEPPITLSAYPVCQGKSRKKVRVYFLLIHHLTEKCIQYFFQVWSPTVSID